MKQGARLAMIRGGTMSLVEKSMTLPNGLRVDPDGTITFPDRTQTMLQPNQMVTMAGMVVPLPPGMPTGGGSRDQTQATKKSTETSAPVIKAGDGTGAR